MKSFAAATLFALVAADHEYGYHEEHTDEYSGPIAPESYGYAVNAWDSDEPTIDAECYAENEIEENAHEIADNRDEIRENDWETRANAADIEELEDDISDLEDCLHRQEGEQRLNRAVVELYCHSQAYVQWIMDECKPVLVDGTRLPYGVDTGYWTVNNYASPASSPHTGH